MASQQQIIVLENNPVLTTVTTIDTSPYNTLPFNVYKYGLFLTYWKYNQEPESIKNGMIFEQKFTDDNITSSKVSSYQDHNYDIATVLGIDDDKRIFVYGKKIGEQMISAMHAIYHGAAGWGIKPNDELLIEILKKTEYKEKNYAIVHNITHAQKKYEIDQHFSR